MKLLPTNTYPYMITMYVASYILSLRNPVILLLLSYLLGTEKSDLHVIGTSSTFLIIIATIIIAKFTRFLSLRFVALSQTYKHHFVMWYTIIL